LAFARETRYQRATLAALLPRSAFPQELFMTFPTNSAPLAQALLEREYLIPTPVQSAVLEAAAAGRDLLVSAQTGSGKTVAFGLAIAETLLGGADKFTSFGDPVALVIAPTRELAIQVQTELVWLYKHTGARVISCVGGMDPKSERRRLNDGAHIVVGTPGRLKDHLERGALVISGLKAVVLDEADEMLDLGFREDLEFILDATPKERQTLMFSATLPKTIMSMARRFQRDALRLEISSGERGHADIEYRAIKVAPNEVEAAVVNVLRFVEAPTSLVFCNTRENVKHLASTLNERGFSTVALSGELSQSERNHAIQALRDGRARVCVATDVAARGLDLPNLGLVVHADLPHDPEVLQHRSGRTGRAGRKGISVLLIPLSKRRRADMMLSQARISPNWGNVPSAEAIRKLDQERLLTDPLFLEENTEEDLAMAKSLMEGRTAEQIAEALARFYRSRLPAPEDVYVPSDRTSPREAREPREERPHEPRPEHAPERGEGVWFHLDIGRKMNADPKWLLPMICRRGNVTKQDIGAIRIFDNETKIEIFGAAADKFAQAIRKAKGGEDVTFTRLNDKADRVEAKAYAPKFKKPHRGSKPFQRRDNDAALHPAFAPSSGSSAPASDGAARPKKPFKKKPNLPPKGRDPA
jgi:ATP-dependent RNA helicase DeaD